MNWYNKKIIKLNGLFPIEYRKHTI
ncbi:hypothetical protein [Enterococcus faecium]|nr:hypothetical protein [Enterococcus faecium]